MPPSVEEYDQSGIPEIGSIASTGAHVPPTTVALVSSPHAHGRMPALRHRDEYLLPAAALAHLAVEARGGWRVRRGAVSWEQAGPDGVWRPVESLMIGEVLWFRPAPGWRLSGPAGELVEPTSVNGQETEGGQQVSVIPRQRSLTGAAATIVPPTRRPA